MRFFIKPLVLCILLLAIPSFTAAQSVSQHPRVRQALTLVEIWLDAQRDYEQIPGVSAGIVHDQQLIWSKGFGYADVGRKTPATVGTIYSICSISKLFTSIGVMQLRDAGKLRLDDPVGRHLPSFTIKRSDPNGPEITIEGILTHSAGLPRESDFPYWTGPDFSFPTRDQVIHVLPNQETLYPAETYFQYSNLGITLAGEIIAAASKQSYEAYIRGHILDPLGLQSTSTEMPEKERDGKLATGYSARRRDGERVPAPFFNARGIGPAAGYASNVEDLARFASWQFRVLARNGGEDVLKANTLREMHRIHWVDPDFQTLWGLGFSVVRNETKTYVGHGGSCPGYRTQLLMKPDEKLAAIFMANAQGVNASEFALRMQEILSPAIKAATKKAIKEGDEEPDTTVIQPARELSQYTGSYESGFAGEIAVIEWEDGLAAVALPTMNPMRVLMKLKKVGEHTFRRIRKDDETHGEAIVFEIGSDGRPAQMIWHSNRYKRVR